MYKSIEKTLSKIFKIRITEERKEVLAPLIQYIKHKNTEGQKIYLNFICTHNSRRSQFAQVWAKVAAEYYNITIESYSGGVEITACNSRTIDSLIRLGFSAKQSNSTVKSTYSVKWKTPLPPLKLYSKLYNDEVNPKTDFAAIMTCSNADENCPFIPGAAARIAIRYKDPKHYDNTPKETKEYDNKALEIAAEMFFVFSEVRKTMDKTEPLFEKTPK